MNITHLAEGGSSLITRKSGHISVLDDLKSATPSVLMVKDRLAGFEVGHKNPPGLASCEYSLYTIKNICYGRS